MQLRYLSIEDNERLSRMIEKNLNKYRNYDHNEWLEKFFGRKDYYYVSEESNVGLFVPYIIPLNSDADKRIEDFENCKRLFEAYRNITKFQATNANMWACLCHSVPEFYEYIHHRWIDETSSVETIRSHFFANLSDALHVENGLSRLYWIGVLTYDSDNPDDPYHLTEIIFRNQRFIHDLLTSTNRFGHKRIKGMLLALDDIMKENPKAVTNLFRSCLLYFSNLAAIRNLDFCSWEEIRDLAYNYMHENMEVQDD